MKKRESFSLCGIGNERFSVWTSNSYKHRLTWEIKHFLASKKIASRLASHVCWHEIICCKKWNGKSLSWSKPEKIENSQKNMVLKFMRISSDARCECFHLKLPHLAHQISLNSLDRARWKLEQIFPKIKPEPNRRNSWSSRNRLHRSLHNGSLINSGNSIENYLSSIKHHTFHFLYILLPLRRADRCLFWP